MRKVGVLAAACVAACAAGASGFKVQSGYLIAAEQKSNSIVAIDARQAGAPAWAWEWKASRDPGIAKGDAKLFYAPSDCKADGDSVLMIASCGNFAELSLATGLAVCYGHVGGNPHSITRLPGKGMFATASSVSHSVTIVSTADNPFSPELQPKKAYPLTSAHGVEWDAKRNCLWALGHTNLVRYAWSETQFELSAVRSAAGAVMTWRLTARAGISSRRGSALCTSTRTRANSGLWSGSRTSRRTRRTRRGATPTRQCARCGGPTASS